MTLGSKSVQAGRPTEDVTSNKKRKRNLAILAIINLIKNHIDVLTFKTQIIIIIMSYRVHNSNCMYPNLKNYIICKYN